MAVGPDQGGGNARLGSRWIGANLRVVDDLSGIIGFKSDQGVAVRISRTPGILDARVNPHPIRSIGGQPATRPVRLQFDLRWHSRGPDNSAGHDFSSNEAFRLEFTHFDSRCCHAG